MKHATPIVVVLLLWLASSPAGAWHADGHRTIVAAAVPALPESAPAFFRQGAATIAHTSVDPDTLRNSAIPQLAEHENAEHYIDLELLDGRELPATRYEYLAQCYKAGQDPRKIGVLPYSVTEWTQRLTLALAEHRRWPENKAIQAKCLVYAGILAHYAGDTCQPLHLTIHHDGRAKPDNSSPRTGIHAKVDAVIEKLELDPAAAAKDIKPQALGDVLPAVIAQIQAGRKLIDRVYELEPKLPGRDDDKAKVDKEVVDFAQERLRASSGFVASLYLTAWENSAKVKLPAWLDRSRD